MQSCAERSSGDLGVPRDFRYAGLAQTTRTISPIRTAIRLLSARIPMRSATSTCSSRRLTEPILQVELNVNLRKRRQELRQNRLQMITAESNGGRHNQVPARRRVLAGGGTLGLGHIGENPLCGGDVGATRVRRHKRAARAIEQFGLQVRFELGHLPAHGRERRFLLTRRGRETAGLGNREHDRHGLEPIHRYFHFLEGYISILPDTQSFRKGLLRAASNGNDPTAGDRHDTQSQGHRPHHRRLDRDRRDLRRPAREARP